MEPTAETLSWNLSPPDDLVSTEVLARIDGGAVAVSSVRKEALLS